MSSVEEILEVIVKFGTQKGTGQPPKESVTTPDFIRVVRQKFKKADGLTRQHILEYLSGNLDLVDENNITDFIHVHMFNKSMRLMKFLQ
jgi:hypothetical protein